MARRDAMSAFASDSRDVAALAAAAQRLPFELACELARRITEFIEIERMRGAAPDHVDPRQGRYVSLLHELAARLGRSPSTSDWTTERRRRLEEGEETIPTAPTLVKYFGGWNAALAAAGLADPISRGGVQVLRKHRPRRVYRYPRERLRRALVECANALGRVPTIRLYQRWRKSVFETDPERRCLENDIPHFRTFENHFGSWSNALVELGLQETKNPVDGRVWKPFS